MQIPTCEPTCQPALRPAPPPSAGGVTTGLGADAGSHHPARLAHPGMAATPTSPRAACPSSPPTKVSPWRFWVCA